MYVTALSVKTVRITCNVHPKASHDGAHGMERRVALLVGALHCRIAPQAADATRKVKARRSY